MQIKKPGDPHKNMRWLLSRCWQCHKCGAIVKVEAHDIESGLVKFKSDQRDGDYYQFQCPTAKCGEFFTISPNANAWVECPSEYSDPRESRMNPPR